MNNSQQRRQWTVLIMMGFAALLIVARLIFYQVIHSAELAGLIGDQYPYEVYAERGTIYDRNGTVLATNGADYQVGVSPNLVVEPELLATALAPILGQRRLEILAALESDEPFVMLDLRVSSDVADLIRDIPYDGVQLDAIPRRFYPQGELMCHTLGYVDYGDIGRAGLEGYYNEVLAGEKAEASINISPLMEQQSVIARDGSDLVLTIDRSVQGLVERHLKQAIIDHRAQSGTIIVMDPRTGAILALANSPCYSPYAFYDAELPLRTNDAVSHIFEPGSGMKLITMAAALDSGTVTPQDTYYDPGFIEIGGHITKNWDLSAPGTTDMTTLLSRSLNVGAATLASWMGAETFFDYMQAFGFGKPTGIDLLSEESGLMPLPGDEYWADSFLATNAYGQGLAVTSIQMITAVSALANQGNMMQPYIVQEIREGDKVYTHEPSVLSRPISAETAQQLTAMAVTAVLREVYEAQVEGYTIAGKTGTAQVQENQIYLPDDVIGSFIGWLPADNPEIIVFVKLDRPKSAPWGSMTAAPTFAKLVEELVVLLDIPPDHVRLRDDVQEVRAGG